MITTFPFSLPLFRALCVTERGQSKKCNVVCFLVLLDWKRGVWLKMEGAFLLGLVCFVFIKERKKQECEVLRIVLHTKKLTKIENVVSVVIIDYIDR